MKIYLHLPYASDIKLNPPRTVFYCEPPYDGIVQSKYASSYLMFVLCWIL